MGIEDLASVESEAGILATLVRHPEFCFHSEFLLPNHFTDNDNKVLYIAITDLAKKGVTKIDPYNIMELFNSIPALQKISLNISVGRVQEFVEMSEVIARSSIEEYKILVNNVMEMAFRRDAYQALKDCENMCFNRSIENLEERIYQKVDGVMTEFSAKDEIPEYKDVIDQYWDEIQKRQESGYAGIKFKFPALNDYATLEAGELFLFAGKAKQGKSMMLLNCAVDLMRQGKSILYIDSELSTRLYTARLLSHITGIKYKDITAGNYTEEQGKAISDAIAWLKQQKFTHIYMPIFDVETVYTTVKKVFHTQGVDVLIIDYFKGSGDGDAFSNYLELGKFVDCVKNKCCGDMNIIGLGAVQATDTGRIADSAKIARNASTIALIENKHPDEIEADGPECGNRKLRIIFNRNGAQMTDGEYIDLQFDGDRVSYEQAQQHVPQMPY